MLKSVVAPQSGSNITARFDPSGDGISLEMRLPQRSQAIAARMANPANTSSEVRIFLSEDGEQKSGVRVEL